MNRVSVEFSRQNRAATKHHVVFGCTNLRTNYDAAGSASVGAVAQHLLISYGCTLAFNIDSFPVIVVRSDFVAPSEARTIAWSRILSN